MKRSEGPKTNPQQVIEWRRRSAERRLARERERRDTSPTQQQPSSRAPQKRSKNVKRNDAPWREECLVRRGRYCRACGAGVVRVIEARTQAQATARARLEIDHVMPRSQGGPSVVENGLVLCAWHHQQKTESRILIQRRWLDVDQIEWLASVGWVCWDPVDGTPSGRGMKHFAAIDAA